MNHQKRREDAATIGYWAGERCFVNLAGDYHYMTTGYYTSQDMESPGKSIHPTCKTSGLGGCGPYELAVAAQRRGYQTRVIVSNRHTPFLASVRSAEKREVIRLVDAQLREEAHALGVVHDRQHFTFEDIVQAIRQKIVPIVLISTYRLHRVKAPHWVVVTGFDGRHVYFHDPYEGFYTGQARHVRIPSADFRHMRRYGKALDKSVLFVAGGRHATQQRTDGPSAQRPSHSGGTAVERLPAWRRIAVETHRRDRLSRVGQGRRPRRGIGATDRRAIVVDTAAGHPYNAATYPIPRGSCRCKRPGARL